MKFEIDDKTGMLEVDNDGFHEYWPTGTKDLEQILQAVKKTQEKLVNKQIQEIQDSKKTIGMPKGFAQLQEHERQVIKKIIQEMAVNPLFYKENERVRTIHLTPSEQAKIERNQKIMDNLEKWYTQLIDQLSMLPSGYKEYPVFEVSEKIRLILEGKDIKDL